MPFTSLATLAHKAPGTIVYANSIKTNFDYLITSVAAMWVDFDGSAAALSARSNVNVSSLTDSGVGTYSISLTTGMAITGYSVVVGGAESGAESNANFAGGSCREQKTGIVRIKTYDHVGSFLDFFHVNVVVIGAKN